MSVSYKNPHVAVSLEWSGQHRTHIAVATAIHAIADQSRDAEAIWRHPTRAERDHVATLVADYLAHGAFPRSPDNKYAWGAQPIEIPLFAIGDRVERGAAEAADRGRVVARGGEAEYTHHLNLPGYVLIAWDSGVFTWTPVSELRST
jgi:hypothetical protein